MKPSKMAPNPMGTAGDSQRESPLSPEGVRAPRSNRPVPTSNPTGTSHAATPNSCARNFPAIPTIPPPPPAHAISPTTTSAPTTASSSAPSSRRRGAGISQRGAALAAARGTAFSFERLVERLDVPLAAPFAPPAAPLPSTLDHDGPEACLDLFGFFAAAEDIFQQPHVFSILSVPGIARMFG